VKKRPEFSGRFLFAKRWTKWGKTGGKEAPFIYCILFSNRVRFKYRKQKLKKLAKVSPKTMLKFWQNFSTIKTLRF